MNVQRLIHTTRSAMRMVFGSGAAAVVMVLLSFLQCSAGLLPYQYESPARILCVPDTYPSRLPLQILPDKLSFRVNCIIQP